MTRHTRLLGPSYVLGEIEQDHTAIPRLAERAAEFGMAPDPRLWGWGTVFRTERELPALAVDTGLATLRAAGVAPETVDALILCSVSITGPSESHGALLSAVLSGLGLGDIPCYGVTLNRCLNLLAALDLADALVMAGRYRRILVVTTDKAADEADRLSNFALFSDGAASCLVTADAFDATDAADPGYQLLGCATAQDTATLDWSNEISADLARRVNDALLTPHGLKVGDLTGLLHANLYLPLVVMKERQAGFGPAQLYTANILRAGHSYAADPLINLVDRAGAGQFGPGSHLMLAASVPGARSGALIRRS